MHHMHKHGWRRAIGFVPLVILGVAAITWVVMCLWNALLPELFGWHTVDFLQALGLLALSKIFFGGWHHGRGGHGCHHRGRGSWSHLTDEEREQLRSKFREHCCGHEHESKHTDNTAS